MRNEVAVDAEDVALRDLPLDAGDTVASRHAHRDLEQLPRWIAVVKRDARGVIFATAHAAKRRAQLLEPAFDAHSFRLRDWARFVWFSWYQRR